MVVTAYRAHNLLFLLRSSLFSPNPPHSRAPFSSPSPPFENFSARRPQNFQITRPFPWSFLKIHPLASTLTITAMDRALAASIGTIQTLDL